MLSLSLSLSETSPAEWKYISEGGATVVFSYQGPNHPVLTGKVLRLRKTPRAREGNGTPGDPDPHPITDEFTVEFQQKVISPRVYGNTWLQAFSAYHEPSRPLERRTISMIDISRRTGVLALDLIGGVSCAVEVKPKWGFLPNPIHLSQESRPIKTRNCRTCMYARLKQTEGKNAAMHYCPLDLFSGSRKRLEYALKGLWDSWVQSNGSINNLRVFSHGKIVRPNDGLTFQAWSRESFSLPPDAALTSIKSRFIDSLLPEFLHTSLLNHISTLQRSLDSLDCEGFAKLVELTRIESAGLGDNRDVNPLDADSMQPTMEDWVSFVDIFLSPEHQKNSSFKPSNLRYHTLAYLLSATFKDCSLIITLRPRSAHEESSSIKVIDLDFKSVNKIPGWFNLDEKIVKVYANIHAGMRKECIEGNSESEYDSCPTSTRAG
ncbi:inositol-pentakisphosphate 2-kinase [Multifurca ochricompacta]|uniref:Inositol-pentakisphosphate 2-kinase n=1 Tax=Multifurca ochricompacta TaxID=376703 RepID=A0AAD4MAY2_9AGAM|nr:inositol-pentakisphosphate 2-kinase [Multifurca ochricompacta]